jgi:3-oxoacyl-[acyl-carrier protein] reductase
VTSLQGKNAIVTGASRNIGRAIALRLARAGCHLSLAAHQDAGGLQETADQAARHGIDTHTTLGDLSKREGCEELLRHSGEKLGPIDVLVHTVAIRPHQPFETVTTPEWESVRSLILDSTMHLALGIVPGMAERRFGRIVLFTGLGAYVGAAERAHVSAAKMGIIGLTRGLAREFAERNIRVNAISPGSIDTVRANPEWYASAPITPDTIPMGRLGNVDEIADAVHFLVSDASGFITGQTLHANGGEFLAG